MARKCKCRVTGEWGTTDAFVKIGGAYYKSQEIYEEYVAHKKQKDEVIRKRKKIEAEKEAENKELYKKIVESIAVDLMDYSPGQPFPKIISRKLKEFEFYDRLIIYMTIQEIKEDLQFTMSRIEFKSDAGKASYIFAAISNHINDIYQREKRKEKVAAESKKASETLLEMTELFDMNDNVAPIKQKAKDISMFLEDEE